ncbi:hypothetical protein GCM10022243_14220 [Saccharothrix violaceirubra]|uniref:NAD(P)-dependent dehydrogenase (Short-subunit alcohol dehydrogenase family) n=1 Tax=Saccharothrix violaceirubra TaxID=413306 RepID=A0A7W7T658_9PSEU|nr:SDR family NAD(P)-dependent oxidoreductase [Saccharothrix violaceirubra]MBB4967297.1 NAD(P)-dependent dehydrogenase (short-subunit alcohol dehydrogenase family) [Saccharothrix violaceirubra]
MTASGVPVRPHLVSFDPDSSARPVHRMTWHPVPVEAAPPVDLTGRRVLVLGVDHDLVAHVGAALAAAGAIVAAPDRDTTDAIDGIVDLNVTGVGIDADGTGDWRRALTATTEALRARYPAWGREHRVDHHWYLAVTAMGGLMGYRHAADGQPLGGVWAGFAKCLPRELPALGVKVVDVQHAAPDVVAAAVLAEIGSWDLFEIGYRDGVRYALTARAEAVEPPAVTLGPDDVVVVSGGARGVGFALARGLAERFGCHVVVTGRGPLPVDAPWFGLDHAAHDEAQRAEIAAARGTADLKRARAAHRRERELRDVRDHLAQAAHDGLRITYEPCDCTDEDQVRALFDRVPTPTVVVHNAGIDEPKRLDLKTADEVVRTVDVKVTGFGNLLRAVLPLRLKAFCNVGSVAGRMGGMIGQVDYAAGNEALARLGFHARDAYGVPVRTLCWPTWDRLGVIANHDAAVRYVSTLAPAEGVERWIAELLTGGTGEVMFLGRVGSALVPGQLRGFRLFTGHPDLARLHGLADHLGVVEEFEPFRRLRCRRAYVPGSHPCLAEVTVAGAPAVPVSVMVEQACALGDWIVPPGWPRQHLVSLDWSLDHRGLVVDGPFGLTAEGSGDEDLWQVTVTVDGAGTVVLTYRPTPPPRPLAPTTPTAPPRFADAWAGLALGRPRWTADAVHLPVTTPADLWTTTFAPPHGIAPTAVETLDRLGARRPEVWPDARDTDRLVVDGGVVFGLHGDTVTLRAPLTRESSTRTP